MSRLPSEACESLSSLNHILYTFRRYQLKYTVIYISLDSFQYFGLTFYSAFWNCIPLWFFFLHFVPPLPPIAPTVCFKGSVKTQWAQGRHGRHWSPGVTLLTDVAVWLCYFCAMFYFSTMDYFSFSFLRKHCLLCLLGGNAPEQH